jgi:hypothetical protein
MTDEMIRQYIDEQEGEQIADHSRFSIDNPCAPRLPAGGCSMQQALHRSTQSIDLDAQTDTGRGISVCWIMMIPPLAVAPLLPASLLPGSPASLPQHAEL